MIKNTDSGAFISDVSVVGFRLVNNRLNLAGQSELAICYHRSCDVIELIDPRSLTFAGHAIVHLIKHIEFQ